MKESTKPDERPGDGTEAEAETAAAANNPFEAVAALWTQGARAYTDAMKAFVAEATRATERGAAAERSTGADRGDVMEATRRSARQWADATARLAALGPRFFERLLDDLPSAATERIEATTFSQLSRMAAARWEEEVRRLSEAPVELGARLGDADPRRVASLLETMSAEYLQDLRALEDKGLHLDLAHLAEAFESVVAGTADDGQRRTIDRLLDAVATKAKYGAEYYADPEATPVGQSEREAVHRVGKITLYRYLPPEEAPTLDVPPVLLVYSIINKPYILDLVPGFSFVEFLLSQGHDVYLIDWGETEPGDRETTLDCYIDPGIRSCVAHIKERTGAEKVSLFGHCIGGNLALLYAALHPEDVSRLITLTTPITSAKGGVVALWTDRDLFPVDAIIDTYGHMPAKLIRYTFMALKPYYEVLKWKMFIEQLHDDRVMSLFYPVDRWANENVDLPGEVFRKFIVEVFHADRFREGKTMINGEIARLENIRCPLLNLYATKDWIVPPESTSFLADLVGSDDARTSAIEGAHVAVMIDPRARKHWTEMSEFLAEP